ncbi:MAG: serine O-acetyltransferase [Rhodospirillaceae bacterium]|nr:serine O-acetyltransferase [Rhodospirillaceae bacterium]|tara:strand:+ start:104 stop:811 length:708 start_codon:yes stop_codon:yes gene_type:complete
MIFKNMRNQISVILEHDPAARSALEVIFCYPGFHAMVFYSAGNRAWRNNFKWLGRFISHLGRVLTGIEIHPAAIIGQRLFIDHGMGVVIGATTEIGNDVTLYQGVTLGGTSLERGTKRHPTLENGVIVGAGAQVLGPITIGENARIGSNAVVVADVAAGTTVVGVPAKAVRAKTQPNQAGFLAYGTPENTSDPVARALEKILQQVQELDSRIKILEKRSGTSDFGKDKDPHGPES